MNTSELELIMAYHDGELTPSQRAEVEGWLKSRPEARAYLDELKAVDNRYREGVCALLEHDEARPLAGRLGLDSPSPSPSPKAGGKTGGLIQFPFRRASRQNWALAASLVLALALGGGWWLQGPQGTGQTAFAGALDRALETTPSGEVYQDAGSGVQIMPLASYHTQQRGHCREYAGRHESRQVFGLACRLDRGGWALVAQQSRAPNNNAGANTYLPASGPEDKVAERLAALGASKALTPEREAQLIAKQWR